MKYFGVVINCFCIFCGCISLWTYFTWGKISIRQTISNLIQADTVTPIIFVKFFFWVIFPSFLLYFLPKRIKYVLSAISVVLTIYVFNVIPHILNQNIYSLLYEKEFASIEDRQIIHPQNKRNLVVIYVESLEKGYGNLNYSSPVLTSYLQKQKVKALSFDSFHQLASTKYTLAAMIASQCGLVEDFGLSTSTSVPFLYPQLNCIPDILAQNGYKNFFYKSADLKFANTIFFAKQHHFDVVKGVNEWMDDFPHEQEIKGSSWGVRDSFLYEQIKKTISEQEKQKQPYSIFAVTVDTHGDENYVDPICPFQERTAQNVIKCADYLLQDFLKWCQEQPFYDNMMIVILGDHVAHGLKNPIYTSSPQNREIENIIFNSVRTDKKGHIWTTFDLAPTIMEALGYKMPALGLGRSLFEVQPTLFEKYGQKFDIMIDQKSRFLENLADSVDLDNFNSTEFLPIENGVCIQNANDLKKLEQYSNQTDFLLDKIWLKQLNLQSLHPQNMTVEIEATAIVYDTARTFVVKANGQEIGKINFEKGKSNNQDFSFNISMENFNDNRLKLEFINNEINYWSIVTQGIGISKIRIFND